MSVTVENKSEEQSQAQNQVGPEEQQEQLTPKAEAQPELSQMDEMLAQSKAINEQLTKFHKHKFVQAYNSIPRLLWFQLLKGVAFGLGSVLGATVVLSALVYLLSQIEFIPFIGEWISEILAIVKAEVPN